VSQKLSCLLYLSLDQNERGEKHKKEGYEANTNRSVGSVAELASSTIMGGASELLYLTLVVL